MANNAGGIVNPVSTLAGHFLKDIGAWTIYLGHRFVTPRKMEPVSRHVNVRAYRCCVPTTVDATFIAPSALVLGNVALGHGTSVMYSAVARNHDLTTSMTIGDHTTIGDRSTLLGQVTIGHNCIIGIGCSLASCTIEDNVYIGHGATISYGAVVERGAIIAPGTTVPMDARVGPGELWAGGGEGEKVDMVSPAQASEIEHRVHDAHHAAETHQHAIAAQYAANETFDKEWLHAKTAAVEEQQKNVTIGTTSADIPLEARRFVQPRVASRRPDQLLRTSTNASRFAPWCNENGPMGNMGNV